MFDLVSSHGMIQAMDKSMTLASRRMALIASNMANIDTPGYKAQDFSFQDAFKQAMDQVEAPAGTLVRTHPGHLAPSSSFLPATADSGQKPPYERNDGNDVNLDRETMKLARTQSTYTLSASFAQTALRQIYQVLREGNR